MDIAFIVCSLLLFAFSVYIGFLIGNTVGVRAVTRADYWKMNGAAIVIAVLLSFILAAVPLFYSVDVGLLAGAIVGLKMAFGESVGPWKFVDRLMTPEALARDRERARVKRAERERARTGAAEPELMSVADDKKKAGNQS